MDDTSLFAIVDASRGSQAQQHDAQDPQMDPKFEDSTPSCLHLCVAGVVSFGNTTCNVYPEISVSLYCRRCALQGHYTLVYMLQRESPP